MLTCVLLIGGCGTTFKETHYFKSASSGSAIPNYYRLTVQGYSALSSSRYISGYFDEDTVNAYFNEFSQPAGGALTPVGQKPPAKGTTSSSSGSSSSSPAAKSADSVDPVAKGLQGQKLIMLLSSNSDEIATQIGALAASKQFTSSLASLVAREQFTAADAAESRLAIEKSRAKTTASLADQLVKGLADNATQPVAEQSLLAFLNSIAPDLGYYGAFATLDDAAKWLDANRTRLVRGEQ